MKKHFYFSREKKLHDSNYMQCWKEVKADGKWVEYNCHHEEDNLSLYIPDAVYLGYHDEWAIKINGVMQGDEQINAILTDNCNAKINNKAQGGSMKKHKLIPANLTAETFIQRTMAGETFRDADENEYKYLATFQTPFRMDGRAMTGYNWSYVPKLFTRVDLSWEDEVSETNPVLCWVSDADKDSRKIARFVVKYYSRTFSQKYLDCENILWFHATPIEKTECYK